MMREVSESPSVSMTRRWKVTVRMKTAGQRTALYQDSTSVRRCSLSIVRLKITKVRRETKYKNQKGSTVDADHTIHFAREIENNAWFSSTPGMNRSIQFSSIASKSSGTLARVSEETSQIRPDCGSGTCTSTTSTLLSPILSDPTRSWSNGSASCISPSGESVI